MYNYIYENNNNNKKKKKKNLFRVTRARLTVRKVLQDPTIFQTSYIKIAIILYDGEETGFQKWHERRV
jgi:hypothetical protein